MEKTSLKWSICVIYFTHELIFRIPFKIVHNCSVKSKSFLLFLARATEVGESDPSASSAERPTFPLFKSKNKILAWTLTLNWDKLYINTRTFQRSLIIYGILRLVQSETVLALNRHTLHLPSKSFVIWTAGAISGASAVQWTSFFSTPRISSCGKCTVQHLFHD